MAEITGKKWKRAYNVEITNPYNGVPQITFRQETMAEFADGQVVAIQGNAAVIQSMADPNTQFNLTHPVTGDVIGSATYQDVYVMLASLYASLAV